MLSSRFNIIFCEEPNNLRLIQKYSFNSYDISHVLDAQLPEVVSRILRYFRVLRVLASRPYGVVWPVIIVSENFCRLLSKKTAFSGPR